MRTWRYAFCLYFHDDSSSYIHQEEETYEEIDPTAIVSGRRARKPVDYSSSEAWAKAGIKQSDDDKDE
jgi:hypothetical protein